MSTATVQVQHTDPLPTVPSGTWSIDPAHSAVSFAVRHLMSRVRGRFTEFDGKVTIADERLGSTVEVEISTASVETGNEMRDNHLRTDDFFGVDEHPAMTFVSTGLHDAEGTWVLDGELTIRGTTRAVRIDLDYLGYDATGLQGEPRIGFEGRTTIRRSDYGVSFGLADGAKIVVSDRVEIVLEIEAVFAGPSGTVG